MTKKVLLTPAIDQFIDQRMKDNNIEPVVLASQKPDDILKQAKDVDGIILMEGAFPNSMFDQLPNLKIVARQGVGYNNVDLDVAAQHGVWVTNTPGGNSVAVAEYVMNDLLTLAKDSYNVSHSMREGDSEYGQNKMAIQISGKTLGIIGYGHIGEAVAKMAAGFGMNVLIYNRTPRDTPYGKMVSKDEIFKTADFITLHLPAVKGTINTVAKDEFKLMKNSAYLLNLGRGPLVNESDLVAALKNHEIAGAALDVYDEEPLPMDSPLRDFKNVFLTPHCAGHSKEAWSQMANTALDNVMNVFNAQKPVTPVNEVK
ncbi:phosphoglycerate dehydrogenase (plasmid) [Nicoliella spurrieriana]|uniref:Phosphoglycerate dehydrogenase n=1 Tax=Nicoliella spurrieriana TaxID=2925830 RepID=A0A976RQM8_9LACO|nr:phosphoglycerate dehydrogenase [Nicoliella spurrieriana]UQS85957.1 phosphoglycerate dehydrogenase [Nicoliella spurrieriana]